MSAKLWWNLFQNFLEQILFLYKIFEFNKLNEVSRASFTFFVFEKSSFLINLFHRLKISFSNPNDYYWARHKRELKNHIFCFIRIVHYAISRYQQNTVNIFVLQVLNVIVKFLQKWCE